MQPRNPTTDHYYHTPAEPHTDIHNNPTRPHDNPTTIIANHAANATNLPPTDHERAYHALIVDLWPTAHTITAQHFNEAITTYPDDNVFPNLAAYEKWVDEIHHNTTPRT